MDGKQMVFSRPCVSTLLTSIAVLTLCMPACSPSVDPVAADATADAGIGVPSKQSVTADTVDVVMDSARVADERGEADQLGEADQPRELAEDRTSSQSKLANGDINFDDLKFDIDKGEPFDDSQLNDRVKSLDGKKVKLSGFILPASTFRQTGIEQFVLVRDNQECCFGPGASLFDCVYVQMVGGNTAEFAVRPVTVEGKFKIDTESYRYPGGAGPDGSSHLAVFEIEGVEVR